MFQRWPKRDLNKHYYRSVFCTEGGDAPWMLDRAG